MSNRRALNALITGVAVAGVVAALAAVRLAPGGPTAHPAVFLALAVACGVAHAVPLLIVRDGETEEVNFDEGVLAAMFLLLPVGAVLAATLASITLGNLRARAEPRKAIFNYGIHALGVSLGLMAQRAIAAPGHGTATGRELAGAGVGVAVFTIVVVGLVWTAISLASGRRFRDIAGRSWRVGSVAWTIAIAWGLVTATAARTSAWTLLLGMVPLIVLRALQRADRDRHHLRGLLRTALDTASAVRAGAVEPSVVAAATDVLDAKHADLRSEPPAAGEIGSVVPSDGGDRWLVVGERDGRDPFDDDDQELLDAMAAIAAIAMENARLLEHVGHDPVIGLPYSSLFGERVALAVSQANRLGRAAVLVVKIDRHDMVSRALGPEPATALLADVGARLTTLLDSDAFAERYVTRSAGYLRGGEFALVLAGVHDDDDALDAAGLVGDALRVPFEVEGIEITVSAAVGVAVQAEGDVDTTANDLIRDALEAASRPSRTGTDKAELAAPTVERAAERLELEAELRYALEHDELVVHYQPEVDVETGRVLGMEALVRWHHPTRGLLPPADFIPLAEETGLIVPLDRLVLRAACRQVSHWRSHLPRGDHLTVSVNLAARQVGQADLAEFVGAVLEDTGLAPGALRLEVTETGVMHDPTSAAARLHALGQLGVQLGIDDFGTGYCSLRYLRDFPVDVLKVDRSFVAGMTDEPQDAAIVAATVHLSHALGLHVVAEGVETDDHLGQLRILGCDQAQGYLWSPPLAPADFERWWDERGDVAHATAHDRVDADDVRVRLP